MSAAKALAYALCDKLESKKVDEVVRNLVSSGWNIREVAWEASSFDHEMPYFDTGRDFDIGFPDTLSSKIEFLTANGSIVQARARLHFKQALRTRYFTRLSLPILPRITLKTTQQLNVGLPRIT